MAQAQELGLAEVQAAAAVLAPSDQRHLEQPAVTAVTELHQAFLEAALPMLAAAAVAEYQTVVALVVLAVQGAVALEAVRQTPEVDRQVLQIPAAVAAADGLADFP